MDEIAVETEALPGIPVHQLEVKKKIIVSHRIDRPEFMEEVETFLSSGQHIWRSSVKLASLFKVDPVELDKALRENDKIVFKKGAEEGSVLYALKERAEVQIKPRAVISDEVKYALAQLVSANEIVEKALKKFGSEIHDKSKDAFAYFVDSKAKMEAGLMHLATATKTNLNNL